jgi:hypothetical protein
MYLGTCRCGSDAIYFPSQKPANMKLAAAIVLLSASASAWTADKASSRRDVLNKVAGAAAVVAAPGVAGAYSVPDLEYGFDALEPFM